MSTNIEVICDICGQQVWVRTTKPPPGWVRVARRSVLSGAVITTADLCGDCGNYLHSEIHLRRKAAASKREDSNS